eukprot:gene7804-1001_t
MLLRMMPTLPVALNSAHPSAAKLGVQCFRRLMAKKIIMNAPRMAPRAMAATNISSFYSENEDLTFSSMHGMEDSVAEALAAAGFTRPSIVQELASPVLMSGNDVVIAAETGSGKTLSYLAPIVSMLIRQKKRQAEAEKPLFFHAVVLCPNATLCHQVVAVAKSLNASSPEGSPQISAAFINSSNPPPLEAPDVVVATPAGLLNFIEGPGHSYGRLWTPDGMQARVRHVVLDEADLLMGRAYNKSVIELLSMLKSGDRRRVESKIFEELGMMDEEFKRIPRRYQVAAWRGGTQGLLDAGFKPQVKPDPEAKYGPYWKRQYVFAAATMPSITYSDAGSEINKLYPDAEWVCTDLLHQSKIKLEHTWVKVDDITWQHELFTAIQEDPDYKAGTARTLVFARDGASAEELSERLDAAKIDHGVYHKSRPLADINAALGMMRQPADGKPRVLVCTDAAARGLDLPGVTHVIQADFAPNAIDFLHRIGRTGRADSSGKVTSHYRDHNVPLVEVLQKFVEEGRPLETAFSRARSFSKKFKKSGGVFAPRGVARPAYDQAMRAPPPMDS